MKPKPGQVRTVNFTQWGGGTTPFLPKSSHPGASFNLESRIWSKDGSPSQAVGTAGNTDASMTFGSLLIRCKQHKTLAWLPRPINNAIPTPAAVNRKQSLVSTIQQFNKHLFLLNNRQPGSIGTAHRSGKASRVAAATARVPCPGSRQGTQPGTPRPTPPESGDCNVWKTRRVAYRRQNPIHQMLQRAVLCSPSFEVQYVLMNPGGRMGEARLQGASGGEGPVQGGSRDSPVLRCPVRRHEHCSRSLRAGAGSWSGVPRGHLGQRGPRALPGLWVSSPPPSPPHQMKPGEGK